MRVLLPTALIAVALACCTVKEETETVTTEGRYQGVGVYSAGSGWARITAPPTADGSRAATLADDDHVIVVSDSQTGEVRQCGDLSGYCITLNPWTQALDETRAAPVALEPLRDNDGKALTRLVPKAEETTTVTVQSTR